MTNDTNATVRTSYSRARTYLAIVASVLFAIFAFAACGTDDTSQAEGNGGGEEVECQDDVDCDPGSVCTPSNSCTSASCDHCVDDQICYVSSDNPDGTCSASDCSADADCGDELDCVDGSCSESSACSSNDDCPDGEICSPGGSCVEGEDNGGGGDDCSDDTECDPGEECEDGSCVDDGSGGGDDCELDPGMCEGATPYLDENACECVECQMTSHCTGDDVCQNGSCVDDGGGSSNDSPGPAECDTTCSQDQPGTCGGDTPYCIDDCCVECIGSADCPGSEICEDNFCSIPGGCSNDADCPSGYECDGGNCAPPDTGGSCDPDDLDSCPDGQICNQNGECEGVGGGDCGMCDPDCTCPGDSVCDGFMCTGCDEMGIITGSDDCPDGQECLFGICMPL